MSRWANISDLAPEQWLEEGEQLALWLARISYAVFALRDVPADRLPAEHRTVGVVWRRQLDKSGCEFVALLAQTVIGADTILERCRWAHLSHAMAQQLRQWKSVRLGGSALTDALIAKMLEEYRGLGPPHASGEARLKKVLSQASKDFVHHHGGPWRAALTLAAEGAGCSTSLLDSMHSPKMRDALQAAYPCPPIAPWIAAMASAPVAATYDEHGEGRLSQDELLFARALEWLRTLRELDARAYLSGPLRDVLLAFFGPRITRLIRIIEAAHMLAEKQSSGLVTANGFDYTVRVLLGFGEGASEGRAEPTKSQTVDELLGWFAELGNLYSCRLDLQSAVEWLHDLSPDKVTTLAKCEHCAHLLLAVVGGTSLPTARKRRKDLEKGSTIMSFEQLVQAGAAKVEQDGIELPCYIARLERGLTAWHENEIGSQDATARGRVA